MSSARPSQVLASVFFPPGHAQGKRQRRFLHETAGRKENSSHITQGLWTKSIMSQLTGMIMLEITATHGEIRAGFPIQRGTDSHHNTQYCKRRPFIGRNYATKTGDSLFIPNVGLGLTPLCHQSLSVATSPPPPPILSHKCPFISPHHQKILFHLFINTYLDG